MSSFTDAQNRIGELDREVTHWVKSQGDTQAKADRLQAELEELELELENARAGEQMFRDEIAELRAEIEEQTAEIPQPWQCCAVNRKTGEERLVASGATEREVKRQAMKIFASSVDAAFPAEEWEIVYRQQPASGSVPDYGALGAAALASLKLGKQAPGYRAAAKAVAQFIKLLMDDRK
jgi:hypothetical protein